MANFQYVTLVAAGGVPIRLADQNGAPYPTTGQGALVFANGPVLTNAQLNGFVLNSPIGANSNGTQASPAFYILTTDKGIYSQGNGNVSITASNFTMASFDTSGGGTFIDFFSANNTKLDITSDTAGEMIVQTFDTSNNHISMTLNKYSGDVNVGSGSIGVGANLGNLNVHGYASVAKDYSASPAGGDGFAAIYFAGQRASVRAGSGAPTVASTLGTIYLRTDVPGAGIPYFNNDGNTGYDQFVGAAATQTLTNKTLTNPIINGGTVSVSSFQVNKGTITADTPVAITETWNNNTITFHSILTNVTTTSFANPSYLMMLRANTLSKFSVDQTGAVIQAAALTVQSGGADVTGASTFHNLLTASSGITVTAGGLTVSAGGATISAGGLTVSAGGATISGLTAVTGNITATASVSAESGTAPSAGGAQDFGFLVSSTAHLGVFFGTGAPSATQAAGSIYIANTNNTPPYYNLTGSNTWDQLVGLAATQTLTNKTISGAANTLTNIALSSLVTTGTPSSSNFLRGDGAWASPLGVTTQVFTSSGTYTPHAKLLYAVIECVGGGGGGGGVVNGGAATGGSAGSGGAGSYARSTVSAATIGASQTVTIGAAGASGVVGGAGGNGGDTSVGTLVIGKGGGGGGANTSGAAGAGGVLGTGDFTVVGQAGTTGFVLNTTGLTFVVGAGGQSYFGGGLNLVFQSATSVGQGATGRGNGGSGGSTWNAAGGANGGTGSAGVVVITEFWVP